MFATTLFHSTSLSTYHSGSLSTMEAAGERGNGDILGEGGVPAGLELGVVGDCIFSHCTMDGRVWLGLRIHLKDRINTTDAHNSPRPDARDTSTRVSSNHWDSPLGTLPGLYHSRSHSRSSYISKQRHFTERLHVCGEVDLV